MVEGTEHPFEADLISNVFPSPDNFFPAPELDEAELSVTGLGPWSFEGELHHEDRAIVF